MLRRDVSVALFASAAGAALLPRASANAMIMCDTTTGVIQFAGAGNTFDATFIGDAGGQQAS